jgi:hypothetical protein
MLVRTGFLGLICCLAAPLAVAETVAKVYPIKDVSEFVSGGNTKIEVTQDGSEYLRIEADSEVMDRIKVDQTGKRLSVWVKSGKGGFFDWFVHGKETVNIILRVKQLDYLELSGGAQARVDDLKGIELDVKTSGAANVKFAQLTMDKVKMDLSGAANVRINSVVTKAQYYGISGASNVEIKEAGRSELLEVSASGASNFRGQKLTAKQADLNASGASHINAAVTESLNADASGASSVDYYGSPRAKTKATGASHVNAHTDG